MNVLRDCIWIIKNGISKACKNEFFVATSRPGTILRMYDNEEIESYDKIA